MDPNFVTAELKGDARVIAKKGRTDRFTCKATYGKIELDVLSVVLGGTVTDNGNTDTTWSLLGDNELPYFKVEYKIEDLDLGLGDLHVVLYKCQLTGGTLVSGKTDEFGQPEMEIEAIPTESDDMMGDIVFYASVTPLSS